MVKFKVLDTIGHWQTRSFSDLVNSFASLVQFGQSHEFDARQISPGSFEQLLLF